MDERIYIYDRSGNYVNDPEQAAKYAQDLRWESMWPKGYGPSSFTVPRDILATWAVKQAYGVIVRDGARNIYQGRLDNLESELAKSSGPRVSVRASGWYAVLNERRIRKRWVDNEPYSRMIWPASRRTVPSQMNIDVTKFENGLMMRGGYGDVTKTNGDDFWMRYTMPSGSYVRRVESKYALRTGEGIKVAWYDATNLSEELSFTDSSGTEQTSSSFNVTLSNADCASLDARFTLTATDLYDENDRCHLYDIVMKAHYHSSHSAYASPAYTNGELVEDILLLARGSELSADVDGISDPGLSITAFISQGDDYESADSLIQRLAAYGDSSQNTWGAVVWDKTGASDGLPKLSFEARSLSDYEYAINMLDLDEFSEEPDISELWNNILVRYIDEYKQVKYLTGDDDATLKDTTSINTYGEIHSPVIDIGAGGQTVAQYIGQRALALHKDPLYRVRMAITGQIRNKQGVWVPANKVRAGQRMKLLDWRGGTTYFLRHTRYDVESGQLEMYPDLPPDTLDMWLAQQELN